jgi:hypothetical protein
MLKRAFEFGATRRATVLDGWVLGGYQVLVLEDREDARPHALRRAQ